MLLMLCVNCAAAAVLKFLHCEINKGNICSLIIQGYKNSKKIKNVLTWITPTGGSIGNRGSSCGSSTCCWPGGTWTVHRHSTRSLSLAASSTPTSISPTQPRSSSTGTGEEQTQRAKELCLMVAATIIIMFQIDLQQGSYVFIHLLVWWWDGSMKIPISCWSVGWLVDWLVV